MKCLDGYRTSLRESIPAKPYKGIWQNTAGCYSKLSYSYSSSYYYFLLCSHNQLERIRKGNGTETRAEVTTYDPELHRDAGVMVRH